MGMSKSQIELQLQMQTQKAIGDLHKRVDHLEKMVRVIDGNMRQSHTLLLTDMTRYSTLQSTHINFILNEMRSKMTEEEIKDFEARFKVFAEEERKRLLANHEKMVAQQREAEEKKRLEEAGKNMTEN